MSAKAACAWGDGPDVLVTVDRNNVSGYPWTKYAEGSPSGKTSEGSFGLTIDEAVAFAAELVQGALRATHLNAGYFEAARRMPDGTVAGRSGADERKLLVQMLNARGCTVMNDKDGNLIVALPDHLAHLEAP